MNLIVFDCDETLWKLPYDEENSYMESPKSLEVDVEYNDDIINIYNEKSKNSENKFVILTNRTTKVKNNVIEKLKNDKDIIFDYNLFRVKDRDKSKRLRTLLKKLKDVDYVEFYDDKEKHINSVKTLINEFKNIEFKLYNVSEN